MIKLIFKILCCLIGIGIIASCKKEQDAPVSVDFDYAVVNNNYSVPVYIQFTNKSSGAKFYKWSFENGTPAAYDQFDPGTILFGKAGSYKVKLEAWNDYERKEKIITIDIDSAVKADFLPNAVINDFAPVDYNFNNNSLGANKYNWQFAGAGISTTTDKDPQNIRFTTPGLYKVFLEAQNNRGKKDTVSKWVSVRPGLSASFDIIPSFDDEDYEAPLIATLENHSVSATIHQWSSPGGIFSNAADSAPTVTFSNPGSYTITYLAGNGKQLQTVTKNITVLPNTRLRKFLDIHLGINSADSTIGSYFSTKLRTVIKENQVNLTNGNKIDICYFGLNSAFTFNKFISPDSAQNFTFAAIPGATYTKRINRQELCGCGVNFTSADFDGVINGLAFDPVNVTETGGGTLYFDNIVVPRVVLFQNAAGKKGAIKIKQFVNNGLQSYIICDIKVQKD
jgi:PKD repeat protein